MKIKTNNIKIPKGTKISFTDSDGRMYNGHIKRSLEE